MAKYIQHNNYSINFEEIMPLERTAGGHEEQMKKLFKDTFVISYQKDEGCSGIEATCVLMPDGAYGLYDDYFGTCSGCDSWIDATDEEVRHLCKTLANNAKFFKNLDDVVEYLDEINEPTVDWPIKMKAQILEYLAGAMPEEKAIRMGEQIGKWDIGQTYIPEDLIVTFARAVELWVRENMKVGE